MLLMLQALLDDRFKLRAHREQRETSVYVLTLARSDRRLGSQLTPSSIDCAAIVAARNAQGLDNAALTVQADRPSCIDRVSTRSGPNGLAATYSGDAKTLDDLAQIIAPLVERPVVNRTGLSGTFDVQLRFVPPRAIAANQGAATEVPSLFTAVEEQLGLRLVSDRGPIDVLVIDSAERPTEN